MKDIFVFVGYYLPGFKAGGPARTVENLISALGDEFRFHVVTSDRDLGDSVPYDNVTANNWLRHGKANVFYNNPGLRGLYNMFDILLKFKMDIVHFNSFMSFRYSIFPLCLLRLLGFKGIIIVGPRGEFSEGALASKKFKKTLYILFVKFLRLYHDVLWHASSLYEAADIQRIFGKSVNIKIALDISRPAAVPLLSSRVEDEPLRIVTISRISPIKNLLFSLNILAKVRERIAFSVYGPIEDHSYWDRCLVKAAALPKNISFIYHGPVAPEQVVDTLSVYDLFLFPTFSENFGHVIAEALFSGLPVIISDNTPWKGLSSKGLGWDFSLDDFELFVEAIEVCAKKSTAQYSLWRSNIRSWALNNIGVGVDVEANRNLYISEGGA